MYLYHSFPRRPNQRDYGQGLKILDSILKRGPLLTPELMTAPAYKNLDGGCFIQKRVCFTALKPEELLKHSNFFGEFSLEFDPSALRSFGVLPALYLTPPIPGATLIDSAGAMTLRLLLETHEVFETLHQKSAGGTDEEKEFINSLLPPFAFRR
jgi:hypothetical protein